MPVVKKKRRVQKKLIREPRGYIEKVSKRKQKKK